MNSKVLLVSDMPDLADFWDVGLRKKGIETLITNSAEETISIWENYLPDLIVIQVFGSNFGEFELCRSLRKETVTPILLFGPENNESYFLKAYELQVDECGPNSISPLMFQAKVGAWLRHASMVPSSAIETINGDMLTLYPQQKEIVFEDGRLVKLSNLESRLMLLLLNNRGRFLRSEDLVDRIWGPYGGGDTTLLKNVAYRLRKKLEDESSRSRMIHSQAGSGYKFEIVDK